MRAMIWGTYDLGKPRTRLLRSALRQIDPQLHEIHHSVWDGIEDKSSLRNPVKLLGIALRWAFAYPALIWKFLRARDVDVVVVGYLGLVDVLVLAPFARMRGIPIVWDAFLSLYDTYARDRKMASDKGLRARLLRWAERQACRFADVVVLDTAAHGELFSQLHGVAQDKIGVAFVGAEESAFAALPGQEETSGGMPTILFYGQFIPLHGIDTIVEAALSERGQAFRWVIIGQGQEAPSIDALLAERNCGQIERIAWVDYDALRAQMAQADVCLGIFGTSDKASRVIPNKVFQALAAGKPLITRDSPGMRELVSDEAQGVYLVPAGDSAALLDALDDFTKDRASFPGELHRSLVKKFAQAALTGQWLEILRKALSR